MSQPRFTFCIPNLNKMEYLPACIEGVLAQDCADWKCVFVDGYSTDGSWEYMQQFASDSRFLLLRGLKQGMYADWNECLKYVDTDYFYFLTSDDTCFPSLVSTTVQALDRYSDVDACHFQFALIDQEGKIIKSPEEVIRNHFDFYCDVNKYAHRRSGLCEFMMHFVYRAMYMTITSLVFRSNLIEKLKGFKTNYGPAGDFDWTMRLVLLTDILYIPKLLATWRSYDEQASKKTTLVQFQKTLLDVSRDNLNHFLSTEQAYKLKKPVDSKQILGTFFDNHASSIYKQILTSRQLQAILESSFTLLSCYPFYFPKKIINRISLDKVYSFPSRHSLAQKFIEQYGLDWPPKPIELE